MKKKFEVYQVRLPKETFEIVFDEDLKCIQSKSNKWFIGKDISFIQNWVYSRCGDLAIIPYKNYEINE